MTASSGIAKAGLALISLLVAVVLVSFTLSLVVRPIGRPDAHYWGARILPPGPAEVGLPAIPVRVAPDGALVGLPEHLDWYDYCTTRAPGLRVDFPSEGRFTIYTNPEKLAIARSRNHSLWFEPLLGQVAKASMFREDWQAAPARWRSEGQSGDGVLPAIVFKVGSDANYPPGFVAEFAPDGYVAFLAPSTGYCCSAGFGESPSDLARRGGKEMIFDSCHDSRWDPREVRRYPTDFREQE